MGLPNEKQTVSFESKLIWSCCSDWIDIVLGSLHRGIKLLLILSPGLFLRHLWQKTVWNVFVWFFHCVQGPPGQKGDVGATEIIDYNGNIQEALQVRPAVAAASNPSDFQELSGCIVMFSCALQCGVRVSSHEEHYLLVRDGFSTFLPLLNRSFWGKKEKFCV